MALGYLGVALFAPDMLTGLTPVAKRQLGDPDAMAKVAADVNGLRSSMAKLQLDVASVKSDVAAQASQTQALDLQVSALEDKVRLGQTPVATSSTPSPAAGGDHASIETPGPAAGAASPASDSPKAAKVINAPPAGASPLVTGSVNSTPADGKSAGTDAISFGAPVVKVAPKPFGVLIGSDPSIDVLRVNWSVMIQNYGDKLKNLSPRYADTGDATHPNFTLIAGPLKSKTDAKKLCKELQAQSVTCKVGEFKGEVL